jgi:hypothetical protein
MEDVKKFLNVLRTKLDKYPVLQEAEVGVRVCWSVQCCYLG